jgi:hypothetical protein
MMGTRSRRRTVPYYRGISAAAWRAALTSGRNASPTAPDRRPSG